MGRKKKLFLNAVFAVLVLAYLVCNNLRLHHQLINSSDFFKNTVSRRAAFSKIASSEKELPVSSAKPGQQSSEAVSETESRATLSINSSEENENSTRNTLLPFRFNVNTKDRNNNNGFEKNATDVESRGNSATTQATRSAYYEDGKVVFLNETDAATVKELNEDRSNDANRSPYSIDILIIGSRHKIEQAQVQRKTWASHKAIRNFFLSTEFDNVDPKCMSEDAWSDEDIGQHVKQCKTGSFWKKLGSLNNYTNAIKSQFARVQWLQGKANPTGWVCAQRRFATSFTRLLEAYATPDQLPDYLILADDDTYVNIDKIVKTMIIEPKEHQAKGLDQEQSWFPTQDVPVVAAGCRVRLPDNVGTITFPFGGYGTFFSNGSLKRLIHPLNCDGINSSEFEEGFCTKLLQKDNSTYPMNGLIGEQHFFRPGDSLNQVLYKYSKNVERFCLHSDWFMGYVANFYNISRHTPSINQMNWFDPRKNNVHENRLHQMKDNDISVDSEIYREPSGECKHGTRNACGVGATVCHYMDSDSMERVQRQVSSSVTEMA